MSKRIRIVKKKKTTFDRFECYRHKRMGRSWRRPRGIDCRVRRKYRGMLRTPKAGYGSNKKTRDLLPNYKLKFVVHNMKELECLLMNKLKPTTKSQMISEWIKKAKEKALLEKYRKESEEAFERDKIRKEESNR